MGPLPHRGRGGTLPPPPRRAGSNNEELLPTLPALRHRSRTVRTSPGGSRRRQSAHHGPARAGTPEHSGRIEMLGTGFLARVSGLRAAAKIGVAAAVAALTMTAAVAAAVVLPSGGDSGAGVVHSATVQ